MKVEIIKCLEDNFSYILINEANRNCCVIDPGEADPIINYLQKNKLNLKYILARRDAARSAHGALTPILHL